MASALFRGQRSKTFFEERSKRPGPKRPSKRLWSAECPRAKPSRNSAFFSAPKVLSTTCQSPMRTATGISQDSEKASFWLLESAETGFAPAQYNVGCYWRDASNREKAFEWFMRAAKQNFGPAQSNLGIMYGHSSDYTRAYIWCYLGEPDKQAGHF